MSSQMITDLKNAAEVLIGLAAAYYFINGTYKVITDGVSATLEKEHKEREQRRLNRKRGASQPTNG
jgi:hypothetical protein